MQKSEGTPPEENGLPNGQGASCVPQGQYAAPQGQTIVQQGQYIPPQAVPLAVQNPVQPQGQYAVPQGQTVAQQGQYIPPQGQNIAPQAMPQGQAEVAAIQPMVDRWQNDRPAQGRAVRGMQKAGRVLFIIGLVFAVVAVLMVVILAIKHADMALGTVLTMRTFGRVSLSLGVPCLLAAVILWAAKDLYIPRSCRRWLAETRQDVVALANADKLAHEGAQGGKGPVLYEKMMQGRDAAYLALYPEKGALPLFEKILSIVGNVCFAFTALFVGFFFLTFLDFAFLVEKPFIIVLIGIDIAIEIVRYILRRSYAAKREEALVMAGIAAEDAVRPPQ